MYRLCTYRVFASETESWVDRIEMRDDIMGETAVRAPSDTENIVRALARAFVVAGGVFWVIAAFAGPYVFDDTSLVDSLQTALWPFAATVVILLIGRAYEHLAAVLLFAASTAVLVWGVIYGWEIGVWIVMMFVLIAPMTVAAVLFLLAARAEYQRVVPDEPRSAVGASIPPGSKPQARTR